VPESRVLTDSGIPPAGVLGYRAALSGVGVEVDAQVFERLVTVA
jgi:hypothetical protein